MRNKVEYMNNAPIGIFDSGLGGLTVARAVIDKLPDEEIIYLGDTEHTPYGPRAIAQVRSLTLSALDELASRGVKALVIACNTATAAALADARERYSRRRDRYEGDHPIRGVPARARRRSRSDREPAGVPCLRRVRRGRGNYG